MSSINKSGKRFTPKVNARSRRVSGLMTPQSSQSSNLTQSQNSAPLNVPLSPISQKLLSGNQITKAQTESNSEAAHLEDTKNKSTEELSRDENPKANQSSNELQANNNSSTLVDKFIADGKQKTNEGNSKINEENNKMTEESKINEENNKMTEEGNKITEEGNKITEEGNKMTEENNETTEPSINTGTRIRKQSETGSGYIFTQPTITHRARLNSLSIPTPLSSAYPHSRRNSITSNPNSRRGSIITPSTNPIIGTGLNSRRNSVIGNLNIIPSSRRGSISNTSILPGFGPINTDKNKRSVISNNINIVKNNNNSKDDKPTSIPILKTNRKRRISVNHSVNKRKDVSIGGVSIGGSIAIPKSNKFTSNQNKSQKETLNSNESEGPKTSGSDEILSKYIENENESKINKDNKEKTDETEDKEEDKEEEKDKEQEEDKEQEKEKEQNFDVEDTEKTDEVQFPKKLEITETERKLGKKWVMSKERNKFVLVDITELEDDKNRDRKYDFEYSVKDVREIWYLKKIHNPELTDNLIVDDKKMKLSDLCKPFFPIGKRSINYDKAVEGEKKIIEARKKQHDIKIKARNLRMSEEKLIKLSENDKNPKIDEKTRMEKAKELMEKDLSEDKKKHNVPILQIQDGQVTYSHESTVVNRHEETNNEMEKVEENPFENIVTSRTYSKANSSLKWTPQEVAEFYKAISLWGTDFGLIAQLFPHRTRKQVKSKFLLEEKNHPHLIEFALLRKLPVDIREYSGKTGFKFKTMDEYNSELGALKVKHEEEIKAMEIARAQAQAEDREAQKYIHNSVSQGIPNRRSRKTVIAEFRKNEEVIGSIDSNSS